MEERVKVAGIELPIVRTEAERFTQVSFIRGARRHAASNTSSLFEQKLVGQGVALGPALEPLVKHHALVFSALKFTGQFLCNEKETEASH